MPLVPLAWWLDYDRAIQSNGVDATVTTKSESDKRFGPCRIADPPFAAAVRNHIRRFLRAFLSATPVALSTLTEAAPESPVRFDNITYVTVSVLSSAQAAQQLVNNVLAIIAWCPKHLSITSTTIHFYKSSVAIGWKTSSIGTFDFGG